MNSIFIVALACLATSHFALGIVDPQEQFEIEEGKCDNVIMAEIVLKERVRLSRLPYLTRNETVTWFGDETIYCIMAMSALDKSEGSTVFVKEGGVNHTFVTLEMHSTVNHGLSYTIYVFAKLK